MSRKPSRKKANTKRINLKVYERPFGRGYEKSKFILGSAFMLLLASFVMYKSLLSDNVVLGAYTSRLIAQEDSQDKVERVREIQKKMIEEQKKEMERPEGQKMRPATIEGQKMRESGEGKIKCPTGAGGSEELTASECKKVLEQKRLEMVEVQKRRLENMPKKAPEKVMEKKDLSEPSEVEDENENEIEDEDEVENEINERREQIKSRIELEDGRMRLKTGSESGVETVRELNSSEQENIVRGLEIEGKNLREESGRRVIEGGRYKAKIDLPVSVDASTNQLIVTTTKGDRTVVVLPEDAVANLNSRGIVGQVTDEGDGIEVVEQDGEPVYKIEGVEQKRFLGIVPVELKSRFVVSAVDGSVSQENVNLVSRLFRSFMF